LQRLVSRLRRVLPEGDVRAVLRSEPGGYRLAVAAEAVDTPHFDRLPADDLIRRLETTQLSAPTGDELNALRARIRDVIANGSIPARKALLRALVHEIRVDARDHIQPFFRVPVSGSPAALTAGTSEDTEVHDPKVRALGGDVEVSEHNTNHLPTVNGPVVRLPEPSGDGLRFRDDGRNSRQLPVGPTAT